MKIHTSRLVIAAAALGLASLTFVGVGGYAAFTSQVTASAQVTSGEFNLVVQTGTTALGCTAGGLQQNAQQFGNPGCFEGSAVNGVWQWGDGYNAPVEQLNGQDNGFSLTVPNMSPGVAYSANFSVEDFGTLQGLVTQVTYTPPTFTSSNDGLAQGSEIYLYQPAGSYEVYPNGGPVYGTQDCTAVGDSSTPSTTLGSQCYQGATTTKTDQWTHPYQNTTYWELIGSFNATQAGVAKVREGFVQPWYPDGPNGGQKAPGDEGGVTLKAVVAVHDALANGGSNVNEETTFAPSFAVQGTSLP